MPAPTTHGPRARSAAFAARYVELLEQVGRARLEAGDARGALEAAERGLAVDLLNEVLWRLALEAEGRLGLREAIEAQV